MTGMEVPLNGAYDPNNGTAVNAGLDIANSINTYIGWSMAGNLIPVGEGLLFIINYSNKLSQICIKDIVFSSQDANNLTISEQEYCHTSP